MGSQDGWNDGEKKHKVWHVEGRAVCIRAYESCDRGRGKDFSYENCHSIHKCPNFKFHNDPEKEITDYEPTM